MRVYLFVFLLFSTLLSAQEKLEINKITSQKLESKSLVVIDTQLGNNIFSFNYFALVYKTAAISYERIFLDGLFGVKVPLQLTLDKKNDGSKNYESRSGFMSGIDLNFYPKKQGKLKYFIGHRIDLVL